MDYKTFGENAEIVYTLTVTVNDEDCITLTNYSEESMLEELRKVDHAIAETLQRQYEDLPETGVNEND